VMDHVDGNNRLAKIAKMLGRAERTIVELALTVLRDERPNRETLDAIEITYPTEFDLFTAGDLAAATGSFQAIASKAGGLPITEALMLSRLMRLCMPGLSDGQYAQCDLEIESYLKSGRVGAQP